MSRQKKDELRRKLIIQVEVDVEATTEEGVQYITNSVIRGLHYDMFGGGNCGSYGGKLDKSKTRLIKTETIA